MLSSVTALALAAATSSSASCPGALARVGQTLPYHMGHVRAVREVRDASGKTTGWLYRSSRGMYYFQSVDASQLRRLRDKELSGQHGRVC